MIEAYDISSVCTAFGGSVEEKEALRISRECRKVAFLDVAEKKAHEFSIKHQTVMVFQASLATSLFIIAVFFSFSTIHLNKLDLDLVNALLSGSLIVSQHDMKCIS